MVVLTVLDDKAPLPRSTESLSVNLFVFALISYSHLEQLHEPEGEKRRLTLREIVRIVNATL